jgi:serpin B
MYLKAQWEEPFRSDTGQAPFTRLDGSQVEVATMERWAGGLGPYIPYVRGNGWQAVELPYLAPTASGRLAMTLVLPDDLPSFEAKLSASQLQRITSALATELEHARSSVPCPGVPTEYQDAGCYPYDLHLFMPRFSIETRADLIPALKALGMTDAFDVASADFAGIHVPETDADLLYVAKVIHQANIAVDENGTVAAAATMVGIDVGGGPGPVKTITLRLDRPFLFFLRDLDTGAVLFMGRVVDPSAGTH